MGASKQDLEELIKQGTIPPTTSIMDMEEVRCGKCKWEGYMPQLVPIYDSDPSDPDEVITVAGCPSCLCGDYLERRMGIEVDCYNTKLCPGDCDTCEYYGHPG